MLKKKYSTYMLYSYTCVMTIQNTPNVCLNLNKSITPDTRDSRDSRIE